MNSKRTLNKWLQRIFVIGFIGWFLYITGMINVLSVFVGVDYSSEWFWRTFNKTNSNGVDNPEDFMYWYGYGNEGWGDGYWYWHGYGKRGYGDNEWYGYGYYEAPKCGTAFKTFDRDDEGWGDTTFCEVWYAVPSSPVFPCSSSTSTWKCKSGHEYVTCSADKNWGGSSSSWGGGWWGASQSDYCPDGDYTSSRYDGQCGTAPAGDGNDDDNADDDTADDDTGGNGWATTDYEDGLCKFTDTLGVKLLWVPVKYKAEISYHTSRCTIRWVSRNGKQYLMPYNDILLVETLKIVARLNPEWFENLKTFDEANYSPWYKYYQEILDEKWLLDGLNISDPDKKLNYYDFMVMLLNRLEVEGVIDADKNAEIISNLPISWKDKHIQRVKMLRILAFIDHNIKK